MSETDAVSTTESPTPMNMPGAADAANRVAGEADEGELDYQDNDPDAEEGEQEDVDVEALMAERDQWRRQAQANEKRAKANADKAKAYDSDFERYKAAFEREQAVKNKEKTPDQIKAEAEAETEKRVHEAEAARQEAEASLLRFQLADGIPRWAIGLITATDEEGILEQVEDLRENLKDYVSTQVDSDPRRPAPNPLAGYSGQAGSTPQELFAATFRNIL